MFFFVYLLLNLVFEKPVGEVADVLVNRPLSAFGVGLLVLLLIGPISVLLAVSVIGIAVVPLVLCALLVAWVIGKVAGARWIGMSVLPLVARQPIADDRGVCDRFCAHHGCVHGAAPGIRHVDDDGRLRARRVDAGVCRGVSARESAARSSRRRVSVPFPPVFDHTVEDAKMSSEASIDSRSEQHAGSRCRDDDAVDRRCRFRTHRFAIGSRQGCSISFLSCFAWQLLNQFRGERAFFLVLLAYHIGFWTWKGTTIGGIICQLRVVRIDGTPLRFVDALVRGLSAIFSIVVVGLGVFWILRDPERQAWHDKIAGTYVVKVPRNWPLYEEGTQNSLSTRTEFCELASSAFPLRLTVSATRTRGSNRRRGVRVRRRPTRR